MTEYIRGTTRKNDVDDRPSATGSIKGEDGQLYTIFDISLVHFPKVYSGPIPDGKPCWFIPNPPSVGDDGNRNRASAQNILIAYQDRGDPESWDYNAQERAKRG